ncbi:acyltransferase [Methylocapsa sp. S129]|uniref:acyltransferase family protein n=1 Tax=Methylocapsa sp. S129 TaxID=1641869 RepID=UPI00131BF357|nr:acyltransferase [Methylocapsa sp. S129]
MGKDHAYSALDGLRGIAAISVVIYHYSDNLGWELLPNAYLAVDFFFILSGFVIAHAYEARLQAGQTVPEFMQRRLIRLYPLYWLGTTLPIVVIIAALLLGQPPSEGTRITTSYFLGLLFLPTPPALSVFGSRVFPLNIPAWSLSLEIGVNAIYAFANVHLTTLRLATIVAVSALGLIAIAGFYGTLNLGHSWPTYLGGWVRVFWSFFAGILAFRIFGANRRPTLPSSIAALLAFVMVAAFAWRDDGKAIGLFSALILFPGIVWVGAQVRLNGIAQRLAAWFGAISYALYITHEPIFDALWVLCRLNHWDPRLAFWPNLIGWILIALASAWILDLVYDLPVRAFLTRKLTRRSPELRAAAL